VRLAAKLTGWRIDIKGVKGEEVTSSDDVETEGEEGFMKLSDLANVDGSGQATEDAMKEEVVDAGEEMIKTDEPTDPTEKETE
jgi:transcription antitermination factor NusA-like protein